MSSAITISYDSYCSFLWCRYLMHLRLFWKHLPSCLCSSLNGNESCHNIPSLKYCSHHIFGGGIVPTIHWQVWRTYNMYLALPFQRIINHYAKILYFTQVFWLMIMCCYQILHEFGSFSLVVFIIYSVLLWLSDSLFIFIQLLIFYSSVFTIVSRRFSLRCDAVRFASFASNLNCSFAACGRSFV